mgnify:CR=1 FL=1
MKSNKEKIYDFIQMHDTAEKEGGVSTTYIAQALSLQRTNVSSLLNALVDPVSQSSSLISGQKPEYPDRGRKGNRKERVRTPYLRILSGKTNFFSGESFLTDELQGLSGQC